MNYAYDARMLVDTLSGTDDYVIGTLYDPAGRTTSRLLGNGLTTNYAYYGWAEQVGGFWQGGRLHTLVTGNVQNLSYTYDKVGNITQMEDNHASETSTYGYDGLNRLTGRTLNGTPETYAYDATTGNLASKAGVNYTYNSGHAHAVSSSGSNSYAYDANGNMTQRVVNGLTFNLGYDAENRLVSVSGALTASFVYDGDGNRVKSTISTTTTYFVGNIYESAGAVETKYYYAGSDRIAMRVGTADPYYLLTDDLGSTTVTTDASGNLVSELRYAPWGEVRSGTARRPTQPPNHPTTGLPD